MVNDDDTPGWRVFKDIEWGSGTVDLYELDKLKDLAEFDEEMASAADDDEVIPERILKAFPSVDDILSWDASIFIHWAA
ncbi:uncharacterized protein TRUGW13939_09608 [Talaromyces rugulosus]|uniref:Uncharacterized protein n=1 Tax=Talaromyces rugulosus TaxID=121627 RepID=A0A7H8R8M3_TALRU|nr:uncharacterized protein TRUGW13939_09608 [Talaromyces rugulosus]QKX62447.1 hypothetical protein TRUGW13939_09608 [Talaromyces rugulosus]